MPDIVVKREDLEKMPEKTRQLFLEFVGKELGFVSYEEMKRRELEELTARSSLSSKPPEIIPIEAAIAILAPLQEQGRRAVELLSARKVNEWAIPDKSMGYSRNALAKRLGTSENSVNGIIGSINRRYAYRLNNKRCDRAKCKIIIFDRKLRIYRFVSEYVQNSCSAALGILKKVAGQNVPYEQYNYDGFTFETEETAHDDIIFNLDTKQKITEKFRGPKGAKKVVTLNPAAIEKFMGEEAESHDFGDTWDVGNNTTASLISTVMACDEVSHFFAGVDQCPEEWFDCYLKDGTVKGGITWGKNPVTTEGNLVAPPTLADPRSRY
jgi:hypothetical protein